MNNLWEIRLKVENTGPLAADDLPVTDVLPDGASFIEGSVTIDGKNATARREGGKIIVQVGRIEGGATAVIKYRIRLQ